ncbi:tetratricopeptide repeat protein [Thalassotalea profundi]|uniref:tetratricopeptide repeat protein n=1 Tax=Thalassotalea profundi TaxID=2036687 RepID=UPI001E5A9FF3|nr:tetratricopeptide repeat protein [Thalassotalea profundi]
MTDYPIAITLENFQQIILEQSKSTLVLVDFWAEQVPESVELKNLLTTKLAEHKDTILLTTVDCLTQQEIASQFGLQSLPTAVLIKDGQPIDGISGPQTDESIATFLDKYLPKAEDNFLKIAKEQFSKGKINEAYTSISSAYQLNNDRADIKLLLAECAIQIGKLSEAQSLISSIKMVDQDSYYQTILAKLELAMEAADSPEIQALEEELLQSPDDIELQKKLAAQYSQVNRYEEALAILFTLVQKNVDEGESKHFLLDVLKALPEGDPLASKYRRKLFSMMY